MGTRDGPVQHGETSYYIGCGCTENVDALMYVKGYQKREWLKDMLESDARADTIIETLDADYEDRIIK